MSTSPGQWEVVGGGKSGKKKINSENGNKLNKHQKKKFIDNMPRLDESAPIKESQTIFEAFLEKERKKEEQTKKQNGNVEPTTAAKPVKKPQPKKKAQDKKDAKEVSKSSSLEDILETVSLKELKGLLEMVQAKFPDAPSIWMKDLASYLNLKISCELTDPTFHGKPPAYPTCVLPEGIHSLLVGTISVCTQQTLQLFFEHSLFALAQDMANNLPTYGYRIFLQCLASEKPDLIISNLSKFVELRNSYQNRHSVCLSILWVAGQAGLNDIKAGLKVWLELMFPVVSMRAFSKYTVEYLETLLQFHADTKSAPDVLGVREFFPIFDFLHSPLGSHGPFHKQLQLLYPKLKSLAYGPKPEEVLHNFFPSYLSRLQPSSKQPLTKELLECLVECLTKDKKHCYSVWRQLYTKHLVQSSILLGYLSENRDNLPSGFPHKLLMETLHTFQVTNEEFRTQHKTSLDGYNECVKHCNDLLSKMSVWRFPWRFLVTLFLATAVAFVVYDINLHGSFQASKTGKFLKQYGILAVWQQAWAKITVYSRKTYKWMEKNIPVYYSHLCHTLGPHLQNFWEKLYAIFLFLWQASLPLRDWLNTNVPPLLQKVSDNLPILLAHLSRWVLATSEVLQAYAIWLWKQAAVALMVAGTWLQEHVFTGEMSVGNLQKLAGNAVGQVQQYTHSALQWLMQMVSNT